MKSRAAILTAPGEPLLIDEIDVPDPGPHQVIVKQTATGICASQIHEIVKTPEEKCPRVLGHEGVGVVTHVGKNVTHLEEGDFAITTWVPRANYPGRDFVDGLAPVGTTFRGKATGGAIGTFTEHCLASDQLAVRIAPEHASPEASIVGCAVLTGAGAVLHTAGVRAEESVVVVGAGGIGLCALKMASLLQAYPRHRRRPRRRKARFREAVGRDPHRQREPGRSGRGGLGDHREGRRLRVRRGGHGVHPRVHSRDGAGRRSRRPQHRRHGGSHRLAADRVQAQRGAFRLSPAPVPGEPRLVHAGQGLSHVPASRERGEVPPGQARDAEATPSRRSTTPLPTSRKVASSGDSIIRF